MKLTEAIQFRQPLFESQFKDFKEIVEKQIDNLDGQRASTLRRGFMDLQRALGDDVEELGSVDFLNANFFVSVVKKVVSHPLTGYDLNDIMGAPKALPDKSKIEAYSIALAEVMGSLASKASDPTRQMPDSEFIDSGNGYEIFHIKNYAAARAFCNRYNTNHCIGSSNPDWFPQYENEYQGSTFAITTRDKLIYVHSGDNGFLITSSDNTSEINNAYKERGKGLKKVVLELRQSGLSTDAIREALHTAVGFDYEDKVDEMLDELRSDPTEELVYDTSRIQIVTKLINGKEGIGFKRKADDLQLDITDYNDENVVATLMGNTEVTSLEKVHEMLSAYFGINGINVDRIANEIKPEMDTMQRILMAKIADSFL